MNATTSTSERTVDVIVVGAGPVGENVAGRTASAGLHTVLVEAERLGGECSYWACIPSKALLRPLDALDAARRVTGSAEAVTGVLDVEKVLARRTSFTSNWDDSGQVTWAEGAGIEVLRGYGRLDGERRVVVTTPADGDVTLLARRAVVVATGSVPVEPPLDGLDTTPHWGSREATSATAVPESLAIIGGGVVGVEMARVYAGLGSTVTLLGGDGLLARAEPFAGALVAEGLRANGVDVRLGARARAVSTGGAGRIVTLDDGSTVEAAELLVATGRRPATEDLGLKTLGLEPGMTLAVDEHGRVNGVDGDWLHAVGDVNGRALLTHQGKHQARIVGSVIVSAVAGTALDSSPWSAHTLTADAVAVPQVVFADPQVASVGRTARQAEEAGLRTRVVDLDIAVAGSGLHADGYTGRARFVVDEDRGVLVGVTFVGQDVAELLHSATVAVAGEVPLHRLWHAVPSFPTISEIWLRFLEAYGL
jgi:dihydrolipoamide dehydrogenase